MLFRKKDNQIDISIGITTFANRFETYFKPLLKKIRDYDADTEIIVAINGEHNVEFDEHYRSRILQFLAEQKNVYPVMFPRFRGLSKLWNTIIIHATHDAILMLNDDIMITNGNFIEIVKKNLSRNGGKSFVINESWSHYVVNRKEIDKLGYFDERLLGIGEEDGDLTWRYIHEFGHPIPSYSMKCFENFAEETVRTYQPTNIKCHSGTKYSKFNREFIKGRKYREDPAGHKGMFEMPVSMADPEPVQYPTERFYRENKDKL